MDALFLDRAMELAREAAESGEVPVGAVVVLNGKIIGEGRNRREQNRDPLGHAEIEAIKNAANTLGDWRLDGATLYVTLEPCPMCAGAIINSRISEVVFGAFDKRAGSCCEDSVVNLFSCGYDSAPQVWAGIREEECTALLTDFFQRLR